MKSVTISARFWKAGDPTILPSDATVKEVTLTLDDQGNVRMKGGPTGSEGFVYNSKSFKRICDYGWVACFGSHKYGRCDVSGAEMKRALLALEVKLPE